MEKMEVRVTALARWAMFFGSWRNSESAFCTPLVAAALLLLQALTRPLNRTGPVNWLIVIPEAIA